VVATAYLTHSAELVARTAKLLGDDAGHARYSAIAERVVASFWPGDTQTGYGLALRFGLLRVGEQRGRGSPSWYASADTGSAPGSPGRR
jgi:hypothetical protein